ncbi:MAG TPA: FAD-dependent oxidoreductase [Solirubrobacteraceae bacterium]|nr:FAD-dependent oxidoreductase [Solirubrobacteraceae bacterium]
MERTLHPAAAAGSTLEMAASSNTSAVDFDVIVVGAGIAGCVTAYQLARAGHDVLVIERGAQPGAKNLSGGVLYSRVMEHPWPDFVHEAPVERIITRNCLTFLNARSHVTIDYRDERLANPVNAVSVLRARLDAWLGEQCEQAGATVMPGVLVDSLVLEGDRVTGVRSGDDELRARVVVAADGVNSFLCRNAGIRSPEPPRHFGLGVKSVIALPRDALEDRFSLSGNEGVAYAVVGDCTKGLGGGGFLYTNRDSVSVGVVVRLDELSQSAASSSDLHDHFLSHPAIAPLLKGGELVEYGSHLIAEGGRAMVHDLTRPGLVVVGDAAGLTLNTGFTVRGMDLAAGSGIAAAKTIHAALAAGDTSGARLAEYSAELDRGFVGRDMKTFAKAPAFLENRRMYGDYGQLFADVLYGVYGLDTSPRRHLGPTCLGALRQSPVKMRELAHDAVSAMGAL